MGTFGETKSPATAARKMGNRIVQPERELPVLAETEVLVVGGGRRRALRRWRRPQ